jgi:hypothetical protein
LQIPGIQDPDLIQWIVNFLGSASYSKRSLPNGRSAFRLLLQHLHLPRQRQRPWTPAKDFYLDSLSRIAVCGHDASTPRATSPGWNSHLRRRSPLSPATSQGAKWSQCQPRPSYLAFCLPTAPSTPRAAPSVRRSRTPNCANRASLRIPQ